VNYKIIHVHTCKYAVLAMNNDKFIHICEYLARFINETYQGILRTYGCLYVGMYTPMCKQIDMRTYIDIIATETYQWLHMYGECR
jgi:hypothetical protein